MSFTFSRPSALRLTIGARAASFLGDLVAEVAIVLRAQSHGAPAGVVALLLMGNLVPVVLLAGPAGRLIDRIDNRRLLAAAGLAQGAVCAGLAGTANLGLVLAGVVLLGVGQAVTGATLQALIPSLAASGEATRAIARSQAATTVAGMVAPGASGLLVGTTGTAGPLLIDAATFVLVAVVGVLVGGLRPTAAAEPGPKERAAGGWRIVAGNSVLATALSLLGLFCLLGSLVNVAEVYLVRATLHAGPIWFGLAGSAWAAGMFGASLATGRIARPTGQARATVGAAAVCGIALVGMGLAPAVGWLVAAAVIGGAGNGVMNVANSALLMGTTPPAQHGRIAAVLSAVVGATQVGAYGAAAGLTGVLGPRGVFVLAGALAAVAPVLTGHRLIRAVTREHGSTRQPAGAGPAVSDDRSGGLLARRALGRLARHQRRVDVVEDCLASDDHPRDVLA